MTAPRILPDRFWSKVDKSGECWLWTGAASNGYGRYRLFWKEQQHPAHRLAWESVHGLTPAGLVIDHLCHTPLCVNPDHLRAATPKQNQENRLGARGRSGVRNVYWNALLGKWRVHLRHNYETVDGGCYDTIEEADLAAKALRDRLYTHHLDGLRS